MSLRAIAAARRGNLALGWPADSVDNCRVPSLSGRAALPASHPAPSPYGSGLSAPLLNKGGFGGTPPMPPVRGSSAGSGWQLRPLHPRFALSTRAPFVILSPSASLRTGSAKNLSAPSNEGIVEDEPCRLKPAATEDRTSANLHNSSSIPPY